MKKKVNVPLWLAIVGPLMFCMLLFCSFKSNQNDETQFTEREKSLMRDAFEIGYINAWTEINDQIPNTVGFKTKAWLRKAQREFGGGIVYNFIENDSKCKELKF